MARRHPRRWPTRSREKLIEAVAESDDALIEKYLEEGELPEEHIVSGAKDGFAEARLAPVLVRLGRQGRSASTGCSTSSSRSSPPRSTAGPSRS